MAEKFELDAAAVKSLAELLKATDLTEIEYEVGPHRIRVAREIHGVSYAPVSLPPIAQHSAPPAGAPVVAEAPAALHQGEVITSPMVGTVYLSPEPGAAVFVKVGSPVKQGDTLLIIEAMKVMNPIRAAKDGKVVDILIQDASPVEFGEPLVVIG